MASPAPSPYPAAARMLAALLALAAAACDGDTTHRSPTFPEAPSKTLDASYSGEALLRVDSASAACGFSRPPESIVGRVWEVDVVGDTIWLTEANGPSNGFYYRGTLTGNEFATQLELFDHFAEACREREVWLSGTFSDDFGAFEAYQTTVYGPPEDRTTTEYRWSARRIDR